MLQKKVCAIFLLMILLMLGTAFADTEIDPILENAVSQAILDGGASHGFSAGNDQPLFEVLIEVHDILAVEDRGTEIDVWLLTSSGVYRQVGTDDFTGNSSFSSIPLMLTFQKTDDHYELLTYNEPAAGSWVDDINRYFPEDIRQQAFEGNPFLMSELTEKTKEFFHQKNTGNIEEGPWRLPVNTNKDDPAWKAIYEKFYRYPAWEGRSILTRSPNEQLWFYLSIDGDNGYYSPCTFEKYDKEGNLMVHAVVQYTNGQLNLLEGEYPPWDE